MTLYAEIALLDAIVEAHAAQLGPDFVPYRNHAYRVAQFALGFAGPDALEKVAIAAAFHDLGIWTDGTFDYLAPSERHAHAYLALVGKAQWSDEIVAMIEQHHKITRASDGGLVEAFRRADWIDVTHGVRSFGLDRGVMREVFARWPNAGFHAKLVRLTLGRLRTHPTSPIPVLRF